MRGVEEKRGMEIPINCGKARFSVVVGGAGGWEVVVIIGGLGAEWGLMRG